MTLVGVSARVQVSQRGFEYWELENQKGRIGYRQALGSPTPEPRVPAHDNATTGFFPFSQLM